MLLFACSAVLERVYVKVDRVEAIVGVRPMLWNARVNVSVVVVV